MDTKLFYTQLVFIAAFSWPLLMWLGLRALDKLSGQSFATLLAKAIEHKHYGLVVAYYCARWLGAAFITGMSILALAIVLAA